MRYQHGSGDDIDGCLACFADDPTDDTSWCKEPMPDHDAPRYCTNCSHTVEEVPEPIAE